MNTSTWPLLLGSLLLGACGSEATQQTAKSPEGAAQPGARATTTASDDSSQSRVVIDPEIRKACGLSESETYFDYDSSKVSRSGSQTLTKLATCFESGPLAGRTMHLVGHADPRGEDEYNLALGGRRAESVKTALQAHGLRQARVTTTSRGENEAEGTDEGSWARDRRVDVVLGT